MRDALRVVALLSALLAPACGAWPAQATYDAETTAALASSGSRLALGLADCQSLLWEAAAALGNAPTTPTASLAQRAAERVATVSDYMDRVAGAAPTRVRYKWQYFDKQRVTDGPMKRKVYRSSGVVSGVSAVRFRATRGDVYLMQMTVRDAQGRDHPYALGRWVVEALPRQEVLKFDRPLEVESIALTMRHNAQQSRRMILSLGIPDRPEYAREIAVLCKDARAELNAGRFREARKHLGAAIARLREYRAVREREHREPEKD